jgi:hypothetical protein
MFNLEQLIHLIGARGGTISRAAFDKAVWEFAKQQPNLGEAVTFRALRALDWLGHCESPGYGGRVTIYLSRPALAVLPDFRNWRAVLVGARSPSSTSELQDAAKQLAGTVTVSVSPTVGDANAFSINRVLLEADCLDAIKHAADVVGVAVTSQPASWELACASTSVSGFEKSLRWENHFPVPEEAHHFSPETLRFEDGYSGGLRLARWKEASTNKIIFALREGTRVAFIDGPEWGRHVELSASGASSIRYDAKQKVFAIRASCPPPRLIARALCLCSGCLPDVHESQRGNLKTLWLAFKGVPSAVAGMVSEKLGQEVSSLPFQIE